MPSVLTHYGFNKSVLDNEINFLKGNEDIYLVGAQGPDPFFFYGIIPSFKFRNSSNIRKFGNKLHKIDPFKVFSFFFEYSNKSKKKDILYSYILGAGLHYILDRKIHPYVFYKTGFSDDKKKKRKYFVDHTLFETNLDVLLMNSIYKQYQTTPKGSIKCDSVKIENVSNMYSKLAGELLKDNYIVETSFEDAYEHMCKIENILYSKKGFKKRIVNLLFKNTPFNTMMHPKVVKDDDKIDYLNIKKNKWQDPQSEIFYEKSFYDLVEEAKAEASIWISLVQDAYDGKKVDIEMFTKGLIYDGYKEGTKMKVFKSVYKKGEDNK